MKQLPGIRRMAIIAVLAVITPSIAVAQVQLALQDKEWSAVDALNVKGRNGVLIKQKLSFGQYSTTVVARSWTKGASSFGEAGNAYRKLIAHDYADRKQTIFFAFQDSTGRKADVDGVSHFRVNDLFLANTGINIKAIFGELAGLRNDNANVYYVQVRTDATSAPWHLIVDNEATERSPKTYSARFARSATEFYELRPVRSVRNNKGKITEMTFGSAGFEIRNRSGKAVGAVSLINKGVVYLNTEDSDERFLISAMCAALLLQEQIGTD